MNVPGWPPRSRAEDEDFARAVDGGAPSTEDDELAVVGALRGLGDLGTLDQATRHRIHSGIIERLAPAGEQDQPRRPQVLAGVLVAAAAAVLIVGALGMLLSKDALPGDTLYDVKRAGESASLGLTFDEQGKAAKYLEFAGTRLDELAALHGKGAAESGYRRVLADFTTDAANGAARLSVLGVEDGGVQLTELQGWTRQQATRLVTAKADLPPSASAGYETSVALLSRIDARAGALAARLQCYLITAGESDDLGAVPATGPCDPPQGNQGTAQGEPPPATEPGPRQDLSDGTVPMPTQRFLSQLDSPAPTPPSPTAPGAVSAPPVIPPPIPTPTGPRLPSTPAKPPLLSIPPLIPGLPGLGIG
ncbi:DUF5667 domain-containing protein [Amycolatopsis minnesotensis]|uniref:DUF5667 domain-containing protein n=1 Tax=Amycolatopsis minnesotensis TaxID=337894 RepID=UPI0031D16C70